MKVQASTAPVYIPQKIYPHGTKQYLHDVDGERQLFATKKAYRRALSRESGGTWIEESSGKKRHFIDRSNWFQTSFTQVSEDEFYGKLDVPSTWKKVLSLGLLALQQRNLAFAFLGYSYIPGGVDAQAVGTEFQVNQYTLGYQSYPRAATFSDGKVIITWSGEGQNDTDGLFGRILESNGSFSGSEFQINNYTANEQWDASVKVLNNSRFIVAWDSFGQDGNRNGIFGQIFRTTGNRFGPEFQLNTYWQNPQQTPNIATLLNGGFVGIWTSNGQDGSGAGIYAKRFTDEGLEVGTEFRVNSYTAGDQWYSSADGLTNGGFVVAWHSNGQLNGFDIFAQRFDENATAVGPEFLVNNYTIGDQYAPNLISLTNGGFVVVWTSDGQDGDAAGVYGRVYGANGTALSDEFQANNFTMGRQWYPRVGALSDGGFVVVWTSLDGQDGSNGGSYGQAFSGSGLKTGQEFQINTFSEGDQKSPSAVGLIDGGFIIFWSSFGQDGNATGIFGQRYDASGNPIELELPIPTSPTPTSVSSIITSQVPNSMNTGTVPFVEFVYSQPYTISQNGLTIGTFSFSGGTGQFSNANPNTINLEIDPNYTIQDGDTLTLFTIPEGESFVWEGLTIDSECFDAEGEIIQNQSGENSFQVIFNPKPDTCTFYSGVSKLQTLPLLATGGFV